jgi:hypothetical protein
VNSEDLADMVAHMADTPGGDEYRHGFDTPGVGRSPAPTPARRGKPSAAPVGRGFDRDLLVAPEVVGGYQRAGGDTDADYPDRAATALMAKMRADEEAENEEDESVENGLYEDGCLRLPVLNFRQREPSRGRVVHPRRRNRDELTIPRIVW